MAKLNMEGAKEYSPGLRQGNYHLEITEWDRGKNQDDLRQYIVHFEVVEPEEVAGREMRDWFTVGTPDDPLCKKEETTEDPSNVGAGRLKRLLNKSHTAVTNDDEQWMADSVGNITGAEVRNYVDRNGIRRTGINYEFPEDVEPGLTEGDDAASGRKQGGKKGPAQAARAARGRRRDEDGDEEEEEKPKKGRRRDDDEEEETSARSARGRRARDEEEEEEEEEERPKRGRKPRDEDEEEEEEEEERPRRGRPAARKPVGRKGKRR